MVTRVHAHSPNGEYGTITYKFSEEFPKALNKEQRRVRKTIKALEKNSPRFFLKVREKQVAKRREETAKLLTKEQLNKFRFKSKSELPSYFEECYGYGRKPYTGTSFMREMKTYLKVTGQIIGKELLKIHPKGIEACKDFIHSLPKSEEELPVYIKLPNEKSEYHMHFNFSGKIRSFNDTLTRDRKANEIDISYHKTATTLKSWMKQRSYVLIYSKIAYEFCSYTEYLDSFSEWLEENDIKINTKVVAVPKENNITEGEINRSALRCVYAYDKKFYGKDISRYVDVYEITPKYVTSVKRHIVRFDEIPFLKESMNLKPDEFVVFSDKPVLGYVHIVNEKGTSEIGECLVKLSKFFNSASFFDAAEGIQTLKFNFNGTKAEMTHLTRNNARRLLREVIRKYYTKKGLKNVEKKEIGKRNFYKVKERGLMKFSVEAKLSLRSDLRYVCLNKLKGGKEKYSIEDEECLKWLSENRCSVGRPLN